LPTERHGAGGFHLSPRNDLLGRRFRGAFKILGFDESPAYLIARYAELAPRGMAKALATIAALPHIERTFTSAPRISLVVRSSPGGPAVAAAD
jgi:hypothetical protein